MKLKQKSNIAGIYLVQSLIFPGHLSNQATLENYLCLTNI